MRKATRVCRAIFAGALVVGGLSRAAPARAQSTSDKMLAQSLFDEARSLVEQGRYAEACPKFAESQRLDPGGGTLLNLALCHEKDGKTATAYTELDDALSVAIKDGRKDREQIAREHLAALGPRIPHIVVKVKEESPGFEVHVDGTVVRRPAYGVPAGVDPGRHVVEAFAPGRATFREEIALREGEQKEVVVPPLAALPSEAPPPSSGDTASKAPRTESNPLYTAALGLGAAGIVVGGVAASVWGLAAISRSSNCIEDRKYCNSDGLSAWDREKTWAWIATIGGGVGLVGMVSLIFIPQRVPVKGSIEPVPGGAVAGVSLTAF